MGEKSRYQVGSHCPCPLFFIVSTVQGVRVHFQCQCLCVPVRRSYKGVPYRYGPVPSQTHSGSAYSCCLLQQEYRTCETPKCISNPYQGSTASLRAQVQRDLYDDPSRTSSYPDRRHHKRSHLPRHFPRPRVHGNTTADRTHATSHRIA